MISSIVVVGEEMSLLYPEIGNRSLSPEELCLLGIRHYQQKELSDAVRIFTQVLSVDPVHPRALNALAVIESEMGNYPRSEAWLDKLLTAHPAFDKGYNTRGLLRLKLEKPEEAEKDFLAAITLNPDFAEAYGNLGDLCMVRREYRSAIDYYSRVVSLNPGSIQALCGMSRAFALQGLFTESAAHLSRVFDIAPEYAPAHLVKGDCLRMQGAYSEAVSAYETALKYEPDNPVCHRSLGVACIDINSFARAGSCLLAAQRLDPSDPLIELYLGNASVRTGLMHDAMQHYLRGRQIARTPEQLALFGQGLGNVYSLMGRPDEAITAYRNGLKADPCNAVLHSNLLLTMHYSGEITAADIFNESTVWGDNHSGRKLLTRRDVSPLPLKIGFVSADFRDHSVRFFIEPLLARLNRNRFTVYCYSSVSKPDAATERLKSHADFWVNVFHLPDEALAERIVADRIDILIDLSGHSNGNRLRVFARRAAPIQVTWLGYPGTTGLRAMDYRITDDIADPVGVSDTQNSERLIRLPGCFLCYQPPEDGPELSLLPLPDNRGVTFGSFNNLAKITPETLTAWGEILVRTAGSRLVLKNRAFEDPEVVSYWHRLLEKQGVESSRVSLLPFVLSSRNHFAHYAMMDIALDTFPYNGTTTTCEALWMGVPVITLSGDRHSARVGASLLFSVGLDELVADNWHDYVTKAVQLAGNPGQLQLYRRTVRERLLASPLCDSAGFAARWEDALLGMSVENELL